MNIIDDPQSKTIMINGMKFSYEFFENFCCPDPHGLYVFWKERDGTTTVSKIGHYLEGDNGSQDT